MPVTFTNNYNLPRPLASALEHDSYSKPTDSISVTELCDSPHVKFLRETYDYKEDVSSRIWSLLGKSIHSVLENTENYTYFCNDGLSYRYIKEPSISIGYRSEKLGRSVILSGHIDLFDNAKGIIYDYKVTSKYVFSSDMAMKSSWIWQLNLYAYILRKKGINVSGIKVIGILRDYLASDKFKSDMADIPIAITGSGNIPEIPMYSDREVEDYIEERLEKHYTYNASTDYCSPSERWQRKAYRVMKEGAKRAFRVCDTEQEAVEALQSLSDPSGYKIMYEPLGRRCVDYCPVNTVCHFYLKEGKP